MNNKITKLAIALVLMLVVTSCATTSRHEEGGIGGSGYTEQQSEKLYY